MELLADVILVVHFLFVLFVVGGLAAIWLGAWRGWGFARNPWFRLAHLTAILFVAGQALMGAICPLTLWEDALRGRDTERGFVARWVQSLLYYDWPAWVFTTLYVGFALLVLATFVRLPPRFRRDAGH
ncbi:MAG TPA: DUF2784 domain-containing protein [Pelomicrobium sp.]|nr:DUF2784 domain-containing protein [Pelomicrobium sp.]